jgi:hypothetical protein
LLSLFYWLPSFLEQRYILYAEVSRRWYAAQFPSFWALIFSPWQYGPPQPAQQALSMSFQIGKIHWLVFLLAPLLILWQKKLSLLPRRAARFWLAVFIVAIFLQLPVSKPLWDGLGFARIITFPWRLQAVAVLAVSLLAALLISVLPRQRLAVAVLFILLLFANRRHFAVSLGDYAGDTYLREFGFNGGSAVEYLPIWASEGEYGQRFREQPRNVPVILAPSAMVHIVRADFLPTAILLDLAAPEATTVAVRQYYFPGWEGKLDGRPLPLFPARGGLINFAFPAGEHKIALRFTDTPLRRATKLISLAVLIIGAGWVLKYKHKL